MKLGLAYLGVVLFLFGSQTFADSAIDGIRAEFHTLKDTQAKLQVAALKGKVSQLTAEELSLVYDRLIKDLQALPEIAKPEDKDKDYSEIEFLIQVVLLKSTKDNYAQLITVKNLASRKLYFLDLHNELWAYQLDFVIAKLQKEQIATNLSNLDTRNVRDLSVAKAIRDAQKELARKEEYLVRLHANIDYYIQKNAAQGDAYFSLSANYNKRGIQDGTINIKSLLDNFVARDGSVLLVQSHDIVLPGFEKRTPSDFTDLAVLKYGDAKVAQADTTKLFVPESGGKVIYAQFNRAACSALFQ